MNASYVKNSSLISVPLNLSAMEAEKFNDITTDSSLRQRLHILRQYEENQSLMNCLRVMRDTWLSLMEVPMNIRDFRAIKKMGIFEAVGYARGSVWCSLGPPES